MIKLAAYVTAPYCYTLTLGTFLASLIICSTSTSCFGAPERQSYSSARQATGTSFCLSPQEAEMIGLVNQHRKRRGLPQIPISKSLTTVARIHAADLQINRPDQGKDSRGMECNMHSWSTRGRWTSGCYTNDHRYADLMRGKPREITANAYNDVGYEVVYWTTGQQTTPLKAFKSWEISPDHRALIFETGKWTGIRFQAIGAAITNNYVVLWFGPLKDPLGSLPSCSSVRQ